MSADRTAAIASPDRGEALGRRPVPLLDGVLPPALGVVVPGRRGERADRVEALGGDRRLLDGLGVRVAVRGRLGAAAASGASAKAWVAGRSTNRTGRRAPSAQRSATHSGENAANG